MLKDNPRNLAALNLANEKANWSKPLPAGRFRGISVHGCFGCFVAQVIEISIDTNKKIHVHRVVCAIDCGLAINPDGVKAQMESEIVYGLTAALYGEITFENGKVKQSNFNDYRMLRMNEMPVIQVSIVPSKENRAVPENMVCNLEPPTLANAIFAATGKRIHELPLHTEDLGKA